ncbi:MAG: hypothetical protein LBM27_03040 [Lactobacillaceae bacterium]|jgi:hypothetical protein|nr:hypothetical protein [Lactobacillaceae bacterium]
MTNPDQQVVNAIIQRLNKKIADLAFSTNEEIDNQFRYINDSNEYIKNSLTSVLDDKTFKSGIKNIEKLKTAIQIKSPI